MPFGDGGWQVWRDVLLRTPGFPVDGLELLRTPEAAAVVDAHLAGASDPPADPVGVPTAAELEAALAEATAAGAMASSALAADPLLREAITWQNRRALVTLDHLAREGADVPHNSDRRQREEALARYWQRYCAKNETVGFFGPVCWGTVDETTEGLHAAPGPGLVRERRVFLEHWALTAVAEALAVADDTVRAAFPPRPQPQLTVTGRQVLGPAGRIVELTAAEAALVSRCDGVTPAADVVAAAAAEPGSPLRSAADGYLLLERLVARDVLHWDANLPMTLGAEDALRAVLPPGPARRRFERLCELRDEVAHCAGDAERLGKALAALEAEFVELTGQDAHRRGGQVYAGRTLCHEETARDLDLRLGTDVLDSLSRPLTALLPAARWLTVELATAYGDGLRRLYRDLADEGPVSLADVWFLAQGMLFGPGERPADTVAAEFTRRWARLFDLDALAPGTRSLHLDAAELARRVAEVFPAGTPGWSAGRLHSPDLHLCAADLDAVRAGEHFWVLGELHAAWATFDCSALTVMHPDASRLVEALAHDVGPRRVWPLWPVDRPRHSGRLSNGLGSPGDVQLGFTAATGADPARLLPSTAVRVHEVDGSVVATAPDGRSWPLLEMFSALVSIHAVDTFKLVAAREHTPRITIDRLVVCRESWRTDTDDPLLAPLLRAKGLAARFVAARRWRASAGLPERVYVRVGGETKPVYLDFASPLFVSALCVTLRSAHSRRGATSVVVSEMLPGPEHAWVPDAAGRRYLSELRLHLVDPA
jgi:hypothetical protein